MIMLLDAEEKYAYDASISNFLTLKIWHDLGIDVSGYSDFITDPGGYGNNPSSEIFQDGLKTLFPDFQYMDYEEFEEMTAIAKEVDMNSPEGLYILKNEKLQKLINSGRGKEIELVCSGEKGDLIEFKMAYNEKYGILIGTYFEGMLFEIALAVTNVIKTIDRLYKQLEEEDCYGLYNKAV
ncbi:hypothetical protein FAY30_26450 (plasmid) [Bacillus sp. S3]|uniref:hypothetical protein n=1 Tax=Bacillus sp. S3 TaxID=486398 RepID=UPI001189FD01|nr:hypothetical protein [Bacillus sp. S3]QCJ45483.1 hypothetical protein FAY30_26450 [Bacillus sp. S3]